MNVALICPKCEQSEYTVPSVGTGRIHYSCIENPTNGKFGCGWEYYYIEDEVIHFPYNVIFSNKNNRFFRKPKFKKVES